MSWRNDLPDRNRHGLIIPPTPATSEKRFLPARDNGLAFSSWHHIYWPKKVFRTAGQLACEFRNHPFNLISLPRFQHDEYHARYDDPVVTKYPGEIIPSSEVMRAFLDEADMLVSLDVSMRAIDMINEALYDGRVKHIKKAEENKEAHLERIAKSVGLIATDSLELVSLRQAAVRIKSLQHLVQAA